MAAGAAAGSIALASPVLGAVVPRGEYAKLPDVRQSEFSTDETPTSFDDITTYNNFWEFGTAKDDPARNSKDFEPRPWRITVDGHAEKTGSFHFDDFIKPFDLEERIYRMRCVEAWSMVIPWVGISLADVVKHFRPTSNAKYVAFETLHDPVRMPGQRRPVLEWPYREGLTIEEATNPLTILAVGLRRSVAEPQRRADTTRRALEIRLQGHQEHRAYQFCRGTAANQLEHIPALGIRLLRKRQSRRRPPAMEPGA
jgi:sulfoxide reductase catalytic subunit YedY